MTARALSCPGCGSRDLYQVSRTRTRVDVCCFACGRRWKSASKAAYGLPTTAQRRERARQEKLEEAHERRQGRPGDSHD